MKKLWHKLLKKIADSDVAGLIKAEESYGDSWKCRGGVGAFMMLARKWDRLENQVKKEGYDVFKAAFHDTRPEGIIDDIRDLRRYLMLVEAEVTAEIEGEKIAVDEAVADKAEDRALEKAQQDLMRKGQNALGMEKPFGFDEAQDVEPAAPVEEE